MSAKYKQKCQVTQKKIELKIIYIRFKLDKWMRLLS